MKLFIALLLAGSIAQAADSLVKFEGKSKKLSGVEVFSEAKISVGEGEEKKELTLKKSGEGIRKKTKAAVITVDVYVAASYVDDVLSLQRAKDPITGLSGQKAKVLRLTMLRGLTAAEIIESFEGSLDMNGVDLKADEVKAVFAQWNSAVKAGDTITLIGYPTKDGDQLFIEVGGKTISSKGKDLSLNFWKIWFGKGDSRMLEVQKLLVGKE